MSACTHGAVRTRRTRRRVASVDRMQAPVRGLATLVHLTSACRGRGPAARGVRDRPTPGRPPTGHARLQGQPLQAGPPAGPYACIHVHTHWGRVARARAWPEACVKKNTLRVRPGWAPPPGARGGGDHFKANEPRIDQGMHSPPACIYALLPRPSPSGDACAGWPPPPPGAQAPRSSRTRDPRGLPRPGGVLACTRSSAGAALKARHTRPARPSRSAGGRGASTSRVVAPSGRGRRRRGCARRRSRPRPARGGARGRWPGAAA